MIDFGVLSTTAATVSVADAGDFTAADETVEAALAEIYQQPRHGAGDHPRPDLGVRSRWRTDRVHEAGGPRSTGGYAQLAQGNRLGIPVEQPCHRGPGARVQRSGSAGCWTIARTSRVHVLAGKAGATIGDATHAHDCEVVHQRGRATSANADIQDYGGADAIVAGATANWSFTCGADGAAGGSRRDARGVVPHADERDATDGDDVYPATAPGSSTRRRS